MKNRDLYFREINEIGDLYLDFVFVEYEEPILFTCIDNKSNLYLCLCSEIRGEGRWIITPTEVCVIKDMIQNNITIYDALKATTSYKYILEWKNGYEKEISKKIEFELIKYLNFQKK